LVPLRVGPVSDQAVREFLSRHADPPVSGAALDRRVVLADGSIGRALWPDTDTDASDRAAERFFDAVSRGAQAWSATALSQAPWSARGEYTALLDALAVRLRERLWRDRDIRWARALRRVEAARWDAQGNLNPQLGLAVLAQDLRRFA